MSQHDGSGDSNVLNVARGLLGIVGDEDDIDEFEDNVEAMLGDADGAAIDGALLGGMGSAMRLGAQATDVREQVQQADEAADGPVVHARERELAGGGVAVRVLCSDPSAMFYRGDESLLVRAAAGEREVPLGFCPGEMEYEDTDSMTEAVVYPAGYEAPAALPAGDEDGEGEGDDGEGEEEGADDA